jgi:hypothetical protein
MKKPLGIALLVVAGFFLCVSIFGVGFLAGRATSGLGGFRPFTMMGRNNRYQGNSMMGNDRNLFGRGGMMGNYRGMMGGYFSGNATNAEPLTIDQARQAVEAYLQDLGNPDLELKEIMIFDNNAYARIVEKSTGIGAMELLVDPISKEVFPEFGPNMMWNLKYGHMGSFGGMMGGYQRNTYTADATMTISPEEALQAAQKYLDQEFPGYKTADDADPFYGYYTIDILKDGKVTGMLSVNGFSGEVFFHSWHGEFIQESE